MVPLWAVILIIVTSSASGFVVGYILRQPRKVKEVDRTEKKEPRELNVFDAYSDEEMTQLRNEAAKKVKYNRKNNLPNWLRDSIAELRKIDDEIEARKNTQLALEEAHRTQHEREMAIFDTVYGDVLKRSELT